MCTAPDGSLAFEPAGSFIPLDTSPLSPQVLPYQPNEVTSWHPAKPAPGTALPPVLALGGAQDRIIRPFQVRPCLLLMLQQLLLAWAAHGAEAAAQPTTP